MVLTTYQKKNGTLVNKETYFSSEYKIGDINGFGWKVVAVKYFYKGKYYTYEEYDSLVNNDWKKGLKKNKAKQKFLYFYKNINHFLVFLILMKILEKLIFLFGK